MGDFAIIPILCFIFEWFPEVDLTGVRPNLETLVLRFLVDSEGGHLGANRSSQLLMSTTKCSVNGPEYGTMTHLLGFRIDPATSAASLKTP